MNRFFAAGLVAGALFLGAQTAQAIEIHDGPTGVTKNEADKTFKGYTLFAPTVKSTTTYLINMDGDIVHTWQSKYPPGLYAQLLPNGNLLRASALPDRPVHIGGAGGLLEESTGTARSSGRTSCAAPGKCSTTASAVCPTATP